MGFSGSLKSPHLNQLTALTGSGEGACATTNVAPDDAYTLRLDYHGYATNLTREATNGV